MLKKFREKLKGNVTHYWGETVVNGIPRWEAPKSKNPQNSDTFIGLTDINQKDIFENDPVQFVGLTKKGKKEVYEGKVVYDNLISCFVIEGTQHRLTAKTIVDKEITVMKQKRSGDQATQ